MAKGALSHPDYDAVAHRLATIAARSGRFAQLVFRSTEPTYASEHDLLTGKGSQKSGGRWNPPNSFATVYAAFTDLTAIAESKAHFVYYRIDPAEALPRTLVAVNAKFGNVVDLTEGTIRQALSISATRMRMDDWRAENRRGNESLTQAIGRAAYCVGLEGLIVPACDGGKNAVWFPGNLRGGSKITIRNADRL